MGNTTSTDHEPLMPSARYTRKHREIIDAARDLFLRQAYLGTSMDEVAASAHVSKQTMYKHFGDKQNLFLEILTGDMGQADERVAALGERVPESDDLPTDLQAFARAYLASILQPHLIQVRRLVIGEAERFPDLAMSWYTSGPERASRMFADWFSRLQERGLLAPHDPLIAGQTFNWLVLSVPINEAMAIPIDDLDLSPSHLNKVADEAVRVFLAAYGSPAVTR